MLGGSETAFLETKWGPQAATGKSVLPILSSALEMPGLWKYKHILR
jgi:hypothetical protein